MTFLGLDITYVILCDYNGSWKFENDKRMKYLCFLIFVLFSPISDHSAPCRNHDCIIRISRAPIAKLARTGIERTRNVLTLNVDRWSLVVESSTSSQLVTGDSGDWWLLTGNSAIQRSAASLRWRETKATIWQLEAVIIARCPKNIDLQNATPDSATVNCAQRYYVTTSLSRCFYSHSRLAVPDFR